MNALPGFWFLWWLIASAAIASGAYFATHHGVPWWPIILVCVGAYMLGIWGRDGCE